MSRLFSPMALGPLSLSNRVAVAPMAQYSANDGCATIWHLQHLMRLAMSGAGLVMVEATAVERSGRAAHGDLGLYSDACEIALADVLRAARAVAPKATKFGIQLGHVGRKGSIRPPWGGGKPLGPGEDPWGLIGPTTEPFAPGWEVPRAANEQDLERLLDHYRVAARRAVRLGFDVLELHMAHGYLLHSFQSPVTNHRNDKWGGSREKRMAFPLTVAEEVARVVPSGVALGARITGTDWRDDGLSAEDAAALAIELKSRGFVYVCVSSGGISFRLDIPVQRGYQVPFAALIRRRSGITTRAVGMILDFAQAEDILASGDADQIALARALIDDPNWVWRAADLAGVTIERPPQYSRTSPRVWPGHPLYRADPPKENERLPSAGSPREVCSLEIANESGRPGVTISGE